MISAHWRTGSASAERVGRGEVGVSPAGYMVAARLGTKGSPLALTAWKGLESHYRGLVSARKAAWALSRCMATDSDQILHAR